MRICLICQQLFPVLGIFLFSWLHVLCVQENCYPIFKSKSSWNFKDNCNETQWRKKIRVEPSGCGIMEDGVHLYYLVYHRNNALLGSGLSWLLGCLTWKYIHSYYLLIVTNLCLLFYYMFRCKKLVFLGNLLVWKSHFLPCDPVQMRVNGCLVSPNKNFNCKYTWRVLDL